MGRDVGGGPALGRRLWWVGVGMVFSAPPRRPHLPYYIGSRGDGRCRECAPHPAGGNGLCARGLRSWLLVHFFSPESGRVFYSVTERRVGAPGGEGQFPGEPSLPGRFIYKVSGPGQKGAPGGDTAVTAPGSGFGPGPQLSDGDSREKPPLPVQCPPRHKAGAVSAGSSRLSIPTFGVRPRAKRLSIIFRF